MDCIFCKIVHKEIPTELLYEDENVVAFNDIHPQALIHVLVVPKIHVDDFYNLKDESILIGIKNAIQHLIDQKLANKGYRLEVNGGGAQLVNHLHFHLMGPILPVSA